MATCKQPRVVAAELAVEEAWRALCASGGTRLDANRHTALRRASYEARARYLQAKDHLRQVGQRGC